MSGRSAYARKKITEPKSGDRSRGRAKSSAGSDDATVSDHFIGARPALRHGRDPERAMDIAGSGTANVASALFSEYPEEGMPGYRSGIRSYSGQRSGSQSGSSVDGRERHNTSRMPLPPGRLATQADDLSGIEKSGLRSVLDKKSDGVRKGLAKAFGFKKKGSRGDDTEKVTGPRPESSATVRPFYSAGVRHEDLEEVYELSPTHVWHHGVSQASALPRDRTTNAVPAPNLPLTELAGGSPLIKRWAGAGRPVQRWNKLRKDPELWDPNGDVLVFLGHKSQSPSLDPSFRLSSHIIEATGSRYLMTLLRQGSVGEEVHIPASPAGAPPMLQRQGPYNQHLPVPRGFGPGGQPTPPRSEDSSRWETDGQVSYEMHFPAPPNLPALDRLRHHIATRNVFALLCHASLVGFSLHQALTDLQSRLDSYMPPEADTVGTLISYLSTRGIDDVRNDPETAVGLLAWSEDRDVRWEEGWRESFLHCAGMYPRAEAGADFRHVTPVTRALLERAWLETQLRVQAAEERLEGFEYGDMWPAEVTITASTSGPVVAAPAKAAMDRLQQFFVRYYAEEFGSWPPPPSPMLRGSGGGDGDMWLTRTVTQLLQRDFAALYDYLVNRDIVWSHSETQPHSKWTMVSKNPRDQAQPAEPDTPDLPMTDMLFDFDTKHGFPHIPHPYPLVPDPVPSSLSSPISPRAPLAGRAATIDRRIQLGYTESTNIYLLPPDSASMQSRFVDAFTRFEKADHNNRHQQHTAQHASGLSGAGDLDPSTARRARWVLIYGVLQTLASTAVDAPGVRYKDGVGYFLSVSASRVVGGNMMKGGRGVSRLPPWEGGGGSGGSGDCLEGQHEMSHCWVVPDTWGAGDGGEERPDAEDEYSYGGGRGSALGFGFPMPARSGHSNALGRAPPSSGGSGGAHTSFSSSGSGSASAATAPSYPASDTGSSARSPSSSSAVGAHRGRQFGPLPVLPAEEREWAALGGGRWKGGEQGSRYAFGGAGISELDELLDDEVDVDRDSFIMPLSCGRPRDYGEKDGRAVRGTGGAIGISNPGGAGTEGGGVGPLIRDFDELSVID